MLSNREVAPGVRYLEIEFPVDFTPGQCVSLEIQGVKRHYSIATSSGADELGILYDVFDRGELTPLLSELTSGEAIDVSKPFGEFSCDPNHPAAWIATGTGVAPFLSMVRSGMRSGFMLIHGARRRERFYFSTELSEVLGNRYIRCLSRIPDPTVRANLVTDGIFPGRLTAWLKSHDLALDIAYYLCGGANMVVDVRDILVDLGIPFDSIVSEIYF